MLRKGGSGRACSVYGCRSFDSQTRENHLVYYRFSTLPFKQEKMKYWIAFANRQTVDGKPWAPNANSRICSAHFVGGEKSEDPRKPNYHPTIYPAESFTNNQDQVQSNRKSKLFKTAQPEPTTMTISGDETTPKPKGIRQRKLMGSHVHNCIICGSTKSCSQIGEAHQNKWAANICSLYNVQDTADGAPTKDKMKDIIQGATYCEECLEDLKNIEKLNGQIKRAQTQLQKIKAKYQTKLKDFLRRSLKKQSREQNDDEMPAEHTLDFQAKRKREILFEFMHGAPITQFIGRQWSKNCVMATPAPNLIQNEDQDPEFEAPVSAPPPPQTSKFFEPGEPTQSAKTAQLLMDHNIKDLSISLVKLALPTKSGSISIRTKRISSKVLAEQVIIRKSKPTQIISSHHKIPTSTSNLYKKSSYTCPLPACAKTYYRLLDFQEHMKHGEHDGSNSGFPCTEPDCIGHSKFQTQRGLALHQRLCHMIDSSPPKYALCETCGMSYETKKRGIHLRTIAHNRKEGDGHLRCKFCELTFSHLKVYRAHRATHPEFLAQQKESELLCQYCSKIFYKKWALKDHEMLHTKNFPHLCHICAFGTAQKSTLKTHLLGKHGVPWETLTLADTGTGIGGEPEWEGQACPICEKAFTSLKQFKNHTEFDNGEKKIFKCEHCRKEFCNEKKYVHHELTHNKPRRPIIHCPICNRMFVFEKNLQTHISREHHATAAAKTY